METDDMEDGSVMFVLMVFLGIIGFGGSVEGILGVLAKIICVVLAIILFKMILPVLMRETSSQPPNFK